MSVFTYQIEEQLNLAVAILDACESTQQQISLYSMLSSDEADEEDHPSEDSLRGILSNVFNNAGAIAKGLKIYRDQRSESLARALRIASLDVIRERDAVPSNHELAHDWCLPLGVRFVIWLRQELLNAVEIPSEDLASEFEESFWFNLRDRMPEVSKAVCRHTIISLGESLNGLSLDEPPNLETVRREMRAEADRGIISVESGEFSPERGERGVSLKDAARIQTPETDKSDRSEKKKTRHDWDDVFARALVKMQNNEAPSSGKCAAWARALGVPRTSFSESSAWKRIEDLQLAQKIGRAR